MIITYDYQAEEIKFLTTDQIKRAKIIIFQNEPTAPIMRPFVMSPTWSYLCSVRAADEKDATLGQSLLSLLLRVRYGMRPMRRIDKPRQIGIT
jgi:hypothetical protein